MLKRSIAVVLALAISATMSPAACFAAEGNGQPPTAMMSQSSTSAKTYWYSLEKTYKKLKVSKAKFTTKGALLRYAKSPYKVWNQNAANLKGQNRTFKIAKQVMLYGSDPHGGTRVNRTMAVSYLKSSAAYEHGRLIFKCKGRVMTEMHVF